MFFVGQRVVCVNDAEWPDWLSRQDYIPTLPERGRVYRAREIMLQVPAWGHAEDGLWLAEIVNPPIVVRHWGSAIVTELAFLQSRFRPLHTSHLDVFLDMLEPAPVRVEQREPVQVPS
jgi:hypothetical protein